LDEGEFGASGSENVEGMAASEQLLTYLLTYLKDRKGKWTCTV